MLFCGVQKFLLPIDEFHFLFHGRNYNPLLLAYSLLSHLTSCTPTKSNLYLANFLTAAAVSEPALYRFLAFHVPNLVSFLHGLGRTKVECVWNVMAHDDAREEKWRGNWRMEWVASKRHMTAEHRLARAVQTRQADVYSSPASSRLNWSPRRFNP